MTGRSVNGTTARDAPRVLSEEEKRFQQFDTPLLPVLNEANPADLTVSSVPLFGARHPIVEAIP